MIKKREVYGGGGIIPDIFVPIDTTSNSESFRKTLNKGLMNKFAHEYVDTCRDELNKNYQTEDSFVNEFELSEKEISEFKAFVEDEGIKIPDDDWNVSGEAMLIRTKAFIGRNMFEPNTFYRIIGELNETLLEAIEILKDGRFEKEKLAHRTF